MRVAAQALRPYIAAVSLRRDPCDPCGSELSLARFLGLCPAPVNIRLALPLSRGVTVAALLLLPSHRLVPTPAVVPPTPDPALDWVDQVPDEPLGLPGLLGEVAGHSSMSDGLYNPLGGFITRSLVIRIDFGIHGFLRWVRGIQGALNPLGLRLHIITLKSVVVNHRRGAGCHTFSSVSLT